MKVLNPLFNTDSLKQSRLPWMDFAKGVAVIFVVYRHILIGLNRSGFQFDPFLGAIAEIGYTFRMHLFFIIAGIFIRKSILKRSNGKFVLDKLRTLIYPYIIWTILQITLQIVMGKYTNSSRSAIDYLYIIIRPRALDQFWFIYALFNVTLLYLFLFRISNGNRWVLLVAGVAAYAIAPYVHVDVIDDVLNFFLFMVIGDQLSSFLLNSENRKYLNYSTLIILLIAFSISIWFYFHFTLNYLELALVALLGSGLTINLAFLISTTGFGKFIRIFGFHSLYLFLMHSMLAGLVRVVLTKFLGLQQPELLLIICTLAGCLLPIIVYNLMMRANLWIFFTPVPPDKDTKLSAAV